MQPTSPGAPLGWVDRGHGPRYGLAHWFDAQTAITRVPQRWQALGDFWLVASAPWTHSGAPWGVVDRVGSTGYIGCTGASPDPTHIDK